MANSDKDILITPNTGSSSADPKIEYVGADSSGNDTITVETLYDGTKATLSFEGSAGQLFSVVNDLSSDPIFSVNDVSGIPSIEVDSDGEIRLAEFSGNVGIGTSSPGALLDVNDENAVSRIRISRGGTDLSTSTDIGSLDFYADYTSSPIHYGGLKAYANNLSGLRGSLDFYVKSTSGNVLTGMTLYGTNSGVNVGIGTQTPSSLLDVDGRITANNLTLQNLSAQNSEATAVMIDGSGIIGTRELGSNAFNSTSYLTGNQTITLSGDVSGSGTTSISVTVADDSHNHIISNVDGLQTALDGKLALSGGTITGNVTLTGADGENAFTLSGTSPTMAFTDTGSEDDFYIHINSNNFYILTDRGGVGGYNAWETPHPLMLEADTNIAYIFAQRAFTEAYHPNADTLTTARTIGGVSFNGSANINLPGVNTAGNQNTSGTAAGLSGTPNISVGTISSGAITSTGNFYLDTSPASNGVGDLQIIPSANDSAGVGFAGQVLGVNISSSLSSNSPKQANTWGGVTGATAIALQADDNSYGQFQVWTSPQDSSANTVLTPRFYIAGNGNATFSGTISSGAITSTGTVTATGGNSTNWNTAYGWGNHASQSYATQSYVGTQISNLVDSAPGTLDTLNELAAALGDDANFSTTVTNSIATKLPLAGGTMTGALTISLDGTDVLNFSANSTNNARGISFNGRTALSADYNDGWLRINNNNEFGNGIYTPGNFRADGQVYIAQNLYHEGDTDTRLEFGTNRVRLFAGGVEKFDSNNTYLTGNQTITLSGDVSGSGTTSIAVTVADDSHNHVISNVDGLQSALDGKLSTTGTAANSQLLDSLDSTAFLRSNANDTLSSTLKVTGSIIHEYNASGGYIARPKGAQYVTGSGAHTGAIKIKLPTHGTDDMLSFWVDIYDYSTGESVTMWIGGYLYQTTGNNEWVNTTALIFTEQTGKAPENVRFGADGSNNCIWIGETTDTWTYPQVIVRDFQCGYTADIDAYDDNWNISFVTSFDTVDETHVAKGPVTEWDRVEGKPTIPTNNNQLTNGAGYITDGNTNWNNSYGFITSSDSSITNKLPLAGGTMSGTITGRDFKPQAGYHFQRSDHHSGHLEGSYNNVGANGPKSNPIYTIGSSYNPTDAALGNMYGIGFCSTAHTGINFTGQSNWGMYVAADGDARVWLDGTGGVVSSTGEHYVGSSRVFHDTYHPNADTLTTARTIGGVSFNGSANINLPGVNTAGNQNTSGTAAGLSGTPNISVGTISSGALTVTSSSTSSFNGTGYVNFSTNVGGVGVNGTQGLHIGWNKSNGGREINMIFDGGTGQADTEMIFTSTDGTNYSDIFQINGGGNVDIKNGGLRIGTTTIVDSSRNLTNIGTISSGAITSTGNIVTIGGNINVETGNGAKYLIVRSTSSRYSQIFGYGIRTSPGTGIYNIWPAANDSSTFDFGNSSSTLNWKHVRFHSTNGLSMGSTQFIDSARNLTNIGTISSGNITLTNTSHLQLYTTGGDVGTGGVDLPRGGHITFYGNNTVEHSIGSRNNTGAITDDLRISSYGALYIDLDSNNNNTSTADFVIGRHGGGTGTMSNLFSVSGETGAVISNSNITAYGSASDIRLKENIETIEDSVEKVKKLRGVTFNYKKDGSKSTGLIAQELEKVLPEVVYETHDLHDKDNTFKAVRYGNIVGLLVEAIKDQQKQIDELKQQVASLTSKN